MKQTTRWWMAVLATGALGVAFAGNADSQGKKPTEKHDAAVLNQTLKEVIDAGARIFNEQGDHAGCYRMWQGSLMSIRPFVPPEMQKSIDNGLASAEKLGNFAEKAFALRKVLDDIRAKTKGAKTADGASTGDPSKGQITGRILYEGKPLTGGYFVTLVSDAKKYSSAIQKDGTFQFATAIPPGDYRVAIEPIPGEKQKATMLPARYGSADTSGLRIQVQAGKQNIDFHLVK